MSLKKSLLLLLTTVFMLSACRTASFIRDEKTRKLQSEMRRARTGTNIGDVCLQFLNIITLTALDFDMNPETSHRQFKKFKIQNNSSDTLYVNMLSDYLWKENTYCDFRDVVILPKEKIKLLVPLETNFNVYFRAIEQDTIDEFIEINTSEIRRLGLSPGMTWVTDETEN